MPVLNSADNVKLGSDQVDKLYLGTDQVWSSGPPPPYEWRTDPAVIDYWHMDDAVAGTNLSTAKGARSFEIPVALADEHGFTVASDVSFPDTTSISGLFVVLKSIGGSPGNGTPIFKRVQTGGWGASFSVDWAPTGASPQYVFDPNVLGAGITGLSTDRNPTNALHPGDVGVYCSGYNRAANTGRGRIGPTRGQPNVFTGGPNASIGGTSPVSIDIYDSHSPNLRIIAIGMIEGEPSEQLFNSLWEEYGRVVPVSADATVTFPGDGYVYYEVKSSGTIKPIQDPVVVEELVQAGGGGGGTTNYGGAGGGGAGGTVVGEAILSSPVTAVVGAGGNRTNGSNTQLGPHRALGGGVGAYWALSGGNGGSGGGGCGRGTTFYLPGSGTPGQGHDGGLPSYTSDSLACGGGGGGAGAIGDDAVPGVGGDGGLGIEWPIGSGNYYGGGGGGAATATFTQGDGGIGGGGPGGLRPASNAVPNTGGGGGGSYSTSSDTTGLGGSGVIKFRHPIDYAYAPPAAFDPLTLGWDHAWWAEGPAFQALAPSDGVGVETWPDEIGSADMTQATAGNRPLYSANVARLNGHPAIDPDGVDDFMEFTSGAYSTFSIVVICAPFNGWAGHVLMDSFNLGPTLQIPGGNRHATLAGSAGVASISYAPDYNAHVFTVFGNGAASSIDLDGAPGAVGTLASFSGWQAGVVTVFTNASGAFPLTDPIAFIGMAPGDIRTDPNYTNFVKWVSAHYGTTVFT